MHQNKRTLCNGLAIKTTLSFLNSNRNLIVCKQIIKETYI